MKIANNVSKVRDWAIGGRIRRWQTRFFENRGNRRHLKTGGKGAQYERLIKQMSQEWREEVSNTLKNSNWKWVNGRRLRIGKRAIAASTSAGETGEKTDMLTSLGADEKTGGEAGAVERRIRSTLAAKKSASASALTESHVRRPRPRRRSTVDQIR